MARTWIDRDSVEFLAVTVSAPSGVSLNTLPVAIALTPPPNRPTDTDWHDGSWEGDKAKLLLGPGNLALAAGAYSVWVKITDSPEIPLLHAGTIKVL